MTAAADPPDAAPPRKPGRKALLAGLVLAVAMAGAGFWVTWSGMVGGASEPAAEGTPPQALPDIDFVPIEPVIVSLPGSGPTRQLRFTAQMEVERAHAAEVATLLPRVRDLLNGYLRAVEPVRFDEPGALMRIRGQLLRRIQIVTGEGRVRDLLVTEFILQ